MVRAALVLHGFSLDAAASHAVAVACKGCAVAFDSGLGGFGCAMPRRYRSRAGLL